MATELDTTETAAVVDSTGNVFADLGLPSGEEDMVKVNIARAITNTIKKRGLTQAEAAKIIGTDQAKVSALLRGRLRGFSVERLFVFLLMLGRDVDIHISKRYRSNERGRLKILAA